MLIKHSPFKLVTEIYTIWYRFVDIFGFQNESEFSLCIARWPAGRTDERISLNRGHQEEILKSLNYSNQF